MSRMFESYWVNDEKSHHFHSHLSQPMDPIIPFPPLTKKWTLCSLRVSLGAYQLYDDGISVNDIKL